MMIERKIKPTKITPLDDDFAIPYRQLLLLLLYFVWTRCCTMLCVCHTTSTRATTTGRLLGPKMGNSNEPPHWRESNQGFETFRLLDRRFWAIGIGNKCSLKQNQSIFT